MRVFTHESTIDRPAAAIWPVMSDIAAWPSWTPTVVSATALAEGAPGVGKSYRVAQPKLLPAVWTITEWKEGRGFAWRSKSPGMTATGEHWLEDAGPGRAKLTLRVTFEGILAPVVWLFAGEMTRRYVELEAASLKKKAEA